MRAVWRWGLALSTWLACSTVLAAALDTLNECASINTQSPPGIAALQAECPELEAALAQLGFTDTLPEGWRDSLTREGLHDLATLATRYREAQSDQAPDIAALPAILKDLASEQPAQAKSWWQAFKEWLRSWYADEPDDQAHSWLERWLNKFRPSADLVRTLVYVLLGLVVLAAVSVVINELRAAGLLKRGETQTATRGATGTQLPASSASSMPALDGAALRDQPAILLRLLVARLLATGRLSVDRFLTHRELTTRAAFADSNDRDRFAHVAGMAERLLYGPESTADEQVVRVVAEGRALLQQLDAPRSTPA